MILRSLCANDIRVFLGHTATADSDRHFHHCFRKSRQGIHYQTYPHEEAKLVRCTMGSIYDAIIDLRPDSKTYMQWIALELTSENRKMIFVPEGFAHGFQTIADNTEVFYQMSEFCVPESARGVRWNDPQFNIVWPDDERAISIRDQNFEDFIPSNLPG